MRIELAKVEKRFGLRRGLRGITLSFQQGERVLVLGRNGSGKSTFLKILAGLMTPDRGTVEWWHEGVRGCPSRLAYASDEPLVYDALTVEENLSFFSALSGEFRSIDELAEGWELQECRSRAVRNLSQGERTRIGLCRAFMGAPSLILLDEPTSSLDELSVGKLLETLSVTPALSVVTTHDPSRFADWATRTLFFEEGVVVEDRPEREGDATSLVAP